MRRTLFFPGLLLGLARVFRYARNGLDDDDDDDDDKSMWVLMEARHKWRRIRIRVGWGCPSQCTAQVNTSTET